MAKRKRLTPANPAFLGAAPETKSALSSPMRAAPIADVAREASATAAAEELARSMTEAREGGRLVVTVPLRQVVSDYLVRDRVVMNSEEMAEIAKQQAFIDLQNTYTEEQTDSAKRVSSLASLAVDI